MRGVRACTCWFPLLAGASFALGASAQPKPDYPREQRWSDEVVPQIVVGDAVWLATPSRAKVLALYTEPGGKAKGGIVLVHGLGVHPDWGPIGELRGALAERGFATLSVQMPVLAADASREQYRVLFPLARERIAAAVAWLQTKGDVPIAIVSHSLGASMADAYLTGPDAARIAGWVPLGMLVDFSRAPNQPTLDVIAERDFPEVVSAAKSRAMQLPRDSCSRGMVIGGTDHYFGAATRSVTDAIASFLARSFERRC